MSHKMNLSLDLYLWYFDSKKWLHAFGANIMSPEFCAAHSHEQCIDPSQTYCLRDDMFCFGHYDFNGDGLTDAGPSLCGGTFRN